MKSNMMPLTRCLGCGASPLRERGDVVECTSCARQWPVVQGIPILIDDASSIFKVHQFTCREDTTYRSAQSRVAAFVFRHLPSLGYEAISNENYKRLAGLVGDGANVLVVGGGVDGTGFDALRKRTSLNIVCSDVVFHKETNIVCDGHTLPFGDKQFDLVVMQAVLEHVLEPQVCVDEAHRVLKDDGLIYAETPFMQQVHMGAYDFQRYTAVGHRRVFRRFQEVSSGVVCGASLALCWSLIYFLQSFTSKRKVKTLLHAAGRLLFFPLKYIDRWTCKTRGSLDAAAGFYFMGRKSDVCLTDEELLKTYNGLC